MDLNRVETATFFPTFDDKVDEWPVLESMEAIVAAFPAPLEPAAPSPLTVHVEIYAMDWDSRRPRNCE
jgi:hypothetical protein